MDTQNDHQAQESRLPTVEDLLFVCRKLNEAGAKYIVIGGMAIIQAGYARQTEDIDLLVEGADENIRMVREALLHLPDRAVAELKEDELQKYTVIRVADEFIVDLMLSAGGITYREAERLITTVDIQGVKIPFAQPELLWRMKQTLREKDNLDLLFLKQLLGK
jgi:hypothetical protein